MKIKKLLTITGFCLLFSILVVTFFIIAYKDKPILLNQEICTDQYTIKLPSNCKIEKIYNFHTNIFINNKRIGYITVCTNGNNYSSSISSIVANYMGMHATVNRDIIENDYGSFKMSKVFIDYELSAAQQIKGELPVTNELHYFFTSNNEFFIDLYLDINIIGEETADKIAKTLIMK